MAGGGIISRALGYVINEFVVEGLANNRSFQRFAVKTSKTLEDFSVKASEIKEELAEQLKDAAKNDTSFKR